MANRCGVVAGTLFFNFNGKAYAPRGSWSIMPGAIERESEAALDGTPIITGKPVLPSAEGSITDCLGLSVIELTDADCGTATLETNTKTYVFTEGTFTGRPSIDVSSGEISGIKITGRTCTEVHRGQ